MNPRLLAIVTLLVLGSFFLPASSARAAESTVTSAQGGAPTVDLPDPCDVAGGVGLGDTCATVTRIITNPVGAVADNVVGKMISEFNQQVTDMVKTLFTFWMGLPSPTVAQADGQPTEDVRGLQDSLRPLVLLAAIVSFLIALARVALDALRGRGEGGVALVRNFVILIATTGAAAATVQLFMETGDAITPWIFKTAAGDKTLDVATVMTLMGMGDKASGSLMTLVMFLLVLIASLAQLVMMVFRNALVYLIVGIFPFVGAASGTEEGMVRLKKLIGFTAALLLYKPVAAFIYGAGFRLAGGKITPDQHLLQMVYGVTILFLATLALPMLAKWLVPAAGAAGASSMFSGGAAVATGAAVVAMGASVVATGGASGAAAAGSGASGAGMALGAGSPPSGRGAGGMGPSGAGAAGSDGGQGPAGGSGTAGADGSSGATGTSGSGGGEGSTGAAGGSGTAGADGSSGATGTSGSGGGQGSTGAAGGSGVAGGGSGSFGVPSSGAVTSLVSGVATAPGEVIDEQAGGAEGAPQTSLT